MCLSSDIPLGNIWIHVYIIVLSAYKDIKLHICFTLLLLLDLYYTYENNISCFKDSQSSTSFLMSCPSFIIMEVLCLSPFLFLAITPLTWPAVALTCLLYLSSNIWLRVLREGKTFGGWWIWTRLKWHFTVRSYFIWGFMQFRELLWLFADATWFVSFFPLQWHHKALWYE